jgi:hypothetical protein
MGKRYLLSLLSLLPSFLLALNSLVINEILFKQSSQNQEWIEILNTGEVDVNLDGFYVEDVAKNVTKISGMIAPKQYRVICSDKKKMLLFYPFLKDEQAIQASSWAVLNNDKETLWLKDKTGTVIDSVSYKAKSSHPNDLSLERTNPYDPNSSWDLCKHSNLSTPASPNSILPLKYDIEIIKAKNVQVDGQIEHTVTFRNIGLENITEFTLNCYAYNESNAVGELFFYEEYFAIEDSLTFVTQKSISGYVSYEYEIKSDLDENNLNNTGVSFFNNGALPVVVNEIMFRPNDGEPQWVELKVNDWYKLLTKIIFKTARCSVEIPIESDEYIILTYTNENADALSSKYDLAHTQIITGLKPIYVSGEELSILDPSGNVIESFKYNPKWSSSVGVSAERINSLQIDLANNWTHSLDKIGNTIGRTNSVFSPETQNKLSLSAKPSPYSLTKEDCTIISYSIPEPVSRVNIRIFDLKGRLVRHLVNQNEVSASGTINWEGLNDSNREVKSGVYIVLLDAVGVQSNKVYQKKTTLVIAK